MAGYGLNWYNNKINGGLKREFPLMYWWMIGLAISRDMLELFNVDTALDLTDVPSIENQKSF